MQIGAISSRKYRPDIDGLRAIAVLSVFLYHLQPGLLPGGFLGVDIFFVISGYLITGIILRENALGVFSFSHFYSRRIKRIFPALFVVLVLSAIVSIVLLTPETYFNFMKSGRYASAQLANFFFARDVGYFEEGFSAQPLLHTWSLGVEEQYYLFWPLLIYVCFVVLKRSGALLNKNNYGYAQDRSALHLSAARTVATTPVDNGAIKKNMAVVFIVLAILSYGICVYLAEVNQKLAFYMFYTRAWEFCIGGLITLVAVSSVKTKPTLFKNLTAVAGLVLLGYSFVFVSQEYFGESFLRFGVVIPCVGAALILLPNQQGSWVDKLLSSKPTVAIGKISYSLYLYHWPIIVFYKLYTGQHEISFLASTGIVLLAFILATISYYLVERPLRKSRLADRRVIYAALLVIITFAVIFKNLEQYDLAPWRIMAYPDGEMMYPGYGPSDCHSSMVNEVELHECTLTEEPNAPVVALVGDSHVPNFFQSTVAWAKKNGFNVVGLTIPGCPMLLGNIRIKSEFDRNHELQCERALPLFESRIVNDERVKLILIAQRFDLFFDGINYLKNTRQIYFIDEDGNTIQDHTGYYRNQFSYTVDKIRAADKEPIILKQVPLFSDINECHWKPLIKKIFSKERNCNYKASFIDKWQKPSVDFVNKFTADHQLKVFDPVPYLDSPLQYGSSIYQDIDHLNDYGNRFLISHFIESMDKTIKSLEEEGRFSKEPK
jgi:peptidoglycan/LPS O-acetylase OafA/YrhL